jgi:hypothetical protein
MSVVEFKKKRAWNADNILDCLEITKDAIERQGTPDSILIIPISKDHAGFFLGGKEMSSAEVVGILELVKMDILLGGSDDA